MPEPPGNERALWGLLTVRRCALPNWRGWSVLGAAAILLAVGLARGAYSFLAVNDPKPGGVLVVEGWIPDYGLRAAILEFNHGHYERLYVTGGPLETGAPLSEYRTLAELGAATLVKLGFEPDLLQPVPAPLAAQDRTFTAAVALRRWWQAHGLTPKRVNLISLGPHARRSRLLFEKALGRKVEVGVSAYPSRDFDPDHWWRSSPGVRGVIDEAIAYVYARALFRPPAVGWPGAEDPR